MRRAFGMASARRRTHLSQSSTSSTVKSTPVSPIQSCTRGFPNSAACRLRVRPPSSARSSPKKPRSGARSSRRPAPSLSKFPPQAGSIAPDRWATRGRDMSASRQKRTNSPSPLRQGRLSSSKTHVLSRSGFHPDVSDAEQPEPYRRDIKCHACSRLDGKQGRHNDQETHDEPVRQRTARHPEGNAVRPALMYSLPVTQVGQHDASPGPQRPNQCDTRHPYEYLVWHQEIEQNTDQHEGCRDVNRCCRKVSPVDHAKRGWG